MVLAGCQAHPEPADDGGRFYAYVDASGQLVTLERPASDTDSSAGTRRGDNESPTPATSDATSPTVPATRESPEAAAPDTDQADSDERPLASNPNALWTMEDAFYLSDEEVQRRIEQKDRNRFVTMHDESGHLVTRPVDMVEAREAARARARHKDYQEIGPVPRVEESETAVRADCCLAGLATAPVLKAGAEHLLDFTDRPHDVFVAGKHPGITVRLGPDVVALRVRTWLADGGYVHPQVMLLDAAGVPVSLIESAFTRRYPETWRFHASLEGDVPVPEEAYAAVFFLAYAQVGADGITLSQGARWQEAGQDLRLRGEVTVRALGQ